eukprot:2663967-Prymnesium_polylepis.1
MLPLIPVVARFSMWPGRLWQPNTGEMWRAVLLLLEAMGPLRLLKVSRYLRDAALLQEALYKSASGLGARHIAPPHSASVVP